MARDRIYESQAGERFRYRVERKYVPGFLGESLLYLFKPEGTGAEGTGAEGTGGRFSILVSVPGSLVPRLGPEFDLLCEAGLPHVSRLLEQGLRRDMRLTLRLDAPPVQEEVQGLRKYPLPGADGGEVGSWG